MPTFLQLTKNNQRPQRKQKTRVKDLKQCPQKRGVCFKLFIMTPKKPNSAKRKVAKIKLSTKKFVFGYIPGEGNNLQRFSQVLIRGGLIRDLPGVHYTIIRGKLDLHSVYYRRQGRSKYGTKIWWKPKKKDRASANLTFKKKHLDFIAKKLKQRQIRIYRKHFINWIVYKMYIVRNKKTKKVLFIPQSLFTKPSFSQIVNKKVKKQMIQKFLKKQNRSLKKFLLKARQSLLGTDFLINLRIGKVAHEFKFGKKKKPGEVEEVEKKPKLKWRLGGIQFRGFSTTVRLHKPVLRKNLKLFNTYFLPTIFPLYRIKEKQTYFKFGKGKNKKVRQLATFSIIKKKKLQRFFFKKKVQKLFSLKYLLRYSRNTFNSVKFFVEVMGFTGGLPKIKTHSKKLKLKNKQRKKKIVSNLVSVNKKSLLSIFTHKLLYSRAEKKNFQLKKRNLLFVFLYRKVFSVIKKQPKFSTCLPVKKPLVFVDKFYSALAATYFISLRHSVLGLLKYSFFFKKQQILKKLQLPTFHKLMPLLPFYLIGIFCFRKIITNSRFNQYFLCFRKSRKKYNSNYQYSYFYSGVCFKHFLQLNQIKQKFLLCQRFQKSRKKKLLFNSFKLNVSKIYLLNLKELKKRTSKDFLKQSFFMDKVLRVFVQDGKKFQTERFLEKVAFYCRQQLHCSLFIFFNLILQHCLITIELIPMKQAGRILFVPGLLPVLRQITFALKLLKKSSLTRNEQTFFLRFLTETLDIVFYQRGMTLQKLAKINEIAFNSQPNLHFRWKKQLP